MSHHVADAIEQIHAIASLADDAYLSPAELAEQYREHLEAPDDEEPLYACSVWDAVNKCWVDS